MKRRDFISRLGATAILPASLLPLAGSAFDPRRASFAENSRPRSRALVLIELNGGNDGLNTVIPRKDSRYQAARKTLAVPSKNLITLNDDLGWHPNLRPLAKHLEKGRCSVFNHVGYAGPNRSHFRSMDIWQTAISDRVETKTGWVGRAMQRVDRANAAVRKKSGKSAKLQRRYDLFAIGGGTAPLAFAGASQPATTLASLDDLRARGGREQRKAVVKQLGEKPRNGADSETLDFLEAAVRGTLAMSDRLDETRKRLEDDDDHYPKTPFGRELRLTAALIRSGFARGIYHVRLSGFDTHARQDQSHPTLLTVYARALAAFLDDLDAAGVLDDVLVMTFSEFGRRVRENGSRGTDHGAAGPVLFAGGTSLRSGVFGGGMDLEKLVDGDLEPRTDFRGIYGRLERDWLGIPADAEFLVHKAPRILTS